jgi:hypothetical protein
MKASCSVAKAAEAARKNVEARRTRMAARGRLSLAFSAVRLTLSGWVRLP